MTTRHLLSAAAMVCLTIGAVVWHLRDDNATTASASDVTSTAWVDSDEALLKLQLNQAEVFRRAFWRQPADDDRILHAERRHRLRGEGGSVEEWQWFIAVEPGDAFATWFFEDNPFELIAARPTTAMPTLTDAPEWLPSADTLAGMDHFIKPGSHLHVFRDARSGRLYATDEGGGFTLAQN
ncbi:hypothetical protein [Actomonas aquatica]|uniref:Uncharacterized protein n=1 Tax=Actomonas aquatica TaxID=2866162 RepID=A0ABZ1C5F2_9BACT|nr:hypothetical protein [Opitutus sp. WL0086]WRQ86716.1 hypothetical protein K1X11_018035 [Opitutus sp. WL0086]